MRNREGFGDAGDGSAFLHSTGKRQPEKAAVWALLFGPVGEDPGKDIRDLENMTAKKNWQYVGLLNWWEREEGAAAAVCGNVNDSCNDERVNLPVPDNARRSRLKLSQGNSR